ncbi:MAG: glycosyltransferase family 4 protein [Pirellulales bacterium]|nr:glycosyltransferase family 4 protein [Pirellulales bacterium]
MRIVYLAAGAAGMYCGSCLHDNTLAAALLKLGEEVILAPIYTPLRTDEEDVSRPRVFVGGINAYLQQKLPLLSRLPRWVDRWLNHPGLLRLATRRAASVAPAKLGALTVSMLQGEQGRQRKELAELVDWLADEARPDVVHLSNALMLGLARTIGQRCGRPVVCTLSGEDIFLERLKPPYYEQARQLIRERSADVAAFVALNSYYADYMAEYLGVARARIEVIPHGLNLEGHGGPASRAAGSPRRVGFVARICHDKGLHLLVDAAERIVDDPRTPRFEMHAAGYLGDGDRPYLAAIERRVAAGRLAGRFTYHGELDRAGKIALLQSLDVLALPTVYRESKGLPALEAWANGVPAVLPAHGAFPELAAATGGAVLHEPHNAADLAEKLVLLLADPARALELGRAGQRAVGRRYQAATMAEQTRRLYAQVIAGREGVRAALPASSEPLSALSARRAAE